jgi:D-alanyl-D-alanine carboxypeptidase/D-alanyl-D-alanine-endopeptidase (penicillin-binding protein 4)
LDVGSAAERRVHRCGYSLGRNRCAPLGDTLAQELEERPQAGQVCVRAGSQLGELAELGDPDRVVDPVSELGDRPLCPGALRLERERTCIAVGQRMLQLLERGVGLRLVEKSADALEQNVKLVSHDRSIIERSRPRLHGPTVLSCRSARPTQLLVGLLAGLVALFLAAEAAASLQTRLSRALASSGIPWSATGARVTNLATGRVVFGRGASRSLRPASNEKLLVALTALDELGPRSRIPTHVLGMGRKEGKVWRGSLFLKGFGDPTLSRADLARLAARVRAAGIRRITGSILGDETAFDRRRRAPGWKPSFYKLECPPLSALIVGRAKVDGRTATYPALVAAHQFRAALRAAGVRVRGKARTGVAPDDASFLTRTRSARLRLIVRRMNKESDNFYAEMLLKRLGFVTSGRKGTTAAGADAVRRELAERGIPRAGVEVVDGSGLSRLDRVTARALALVLRSAWRDERIRKPFYASLARAGIDGTLEDRMESGPARGRVRAKTGTTTNSSALSGYVGARFAFVVIQNGNPVPWTSARRSQDRFAQILARRSL